MPKKFRQEGRKEISYFYIFWTLGFQGRGGRVDIPRNYEKNVKITAPFLASVSKMLLSKDLKFINVLQCFKNYNMNSWWFHLRKYVMKYILSYILQNYFIIKKAFMIHFKIWAKLYNMCVSVTSGNFSKHQGRAWGPRHKGLTGLKRNQLNVRREGSK